MTRDRNDDDRLALARVLLRPPRFGLGRLLGTPAALEVLDGADIELGLSRHQRGDWGDLDDEDRAANERALAEGTRLLSAYASNAGVKFWVITEADRSVTTVLLPEDY